MRSPDILKNIQQKGYIVKCHIENFVILYKRNHGYIVWNMDMEYGTNIGHSHLKSYEQAKQICKNIVNEKLPKTNNNYLWGSYFRVLPDGSKYKEKLVELYETKKDKFKNNQKDYININKGFR